jgi:hypothetical protein
MMENMNFGEALAQLKLGRRVQRAGWNGWLLRIPIWYAPQSSIEEFTPLPWIGIETADGGFVPWLASQTDLLAEDWSVV